MTTATFPQDSLLPRPPGGNGPGAALALIVHAGLITALTLGVDWRTHSPEVVSAELWASVPQSAVPPPPPLPEPPVPSPTPAPTPPAARVEPPPPPPDITVERDRQKAEAQRKKAELEAEAERKRSADKKKLDEERKKTEELKLAQRDAARLASEKAEDDRLARQREDNLRRMLGQAGAASSTPATPATRAGTAAQNAAPSASYGGLVRAKIRPLIVFTGYAEFNAAAEVEVTLAPGGSVISRRLIKSSGYKDWDEAVLRAIDKAASMPRDSDGRVPPTLILSFKPTE